MILMRHRCEVVLLGGLPLSMFELDCNPKLTTIRVITAHKSVTVKTHRTTISVTVPLRGSSQFHLEVNTVSPVVIQLLYNFVIVDFWI